MRYCFLFISAITMQALVYQSCLAQEVIQKHTGSVRMERRVSEHTQITDKTTGKTISYQAYQQLLREDGNGYHLEPIFDEYGRASSYTLRPTTAEERENHVFNDRHPEQRPKVGEPMPKFVMKGLDDKMYRLAELKGRVIVLSFWISLSKPFWGPNQAKGFADAMRPYQSETDPISLGILRESREEIASAITSETLPFIPIPDSYGFNEKFHITTGPTFIVIDRAGTVAAFIEGSTYDQLQKVLQTVSR